jgi:hypothetical protein
MSDSSNDRYPDDLGTRRLTNDDPRDDTTFEDVMEAFNAGDAVEHPGVPAEQLDEPESPTSDADLQPPQ